MHDRTSNQYNYRLRKITYEGCTYQEGDVVVIGKNDDDTLMFGVIKSIYHYHNEDKCFLTVTDMQADYLSQEKDSSTVKDPTSHTNTEAML